MSHLSSEAMNRSKSNLTREEIEGLIRLTLAKRLKKPVDDIEPNVGFEEMGLDSLDMAELFFLLEDELDAAIPLDQGVRLETVEEAAALVFKHARALPDAHGYMDNKAFGSAD